MAAAADKRALVRGMLFSWRISSCLFGYGASRRAGLLLLQLLQLFPQEGETCGRCATGLISDGLFLDLRQARVGIFFIPRASRVDIKTALRDQIIERAAIVLQIEDAIAGVEIEIGAVQLVAMGQAAGEISLCQLGLPDLCLDLANAVRALGVEWVADQQGEQSYPESYAFHVPHPVENCREMRIFISQESIIHIGNERFTTPPKCRFSG